MVFHHVDKVRSFTAGKTAMSLELFQFLKDWLAHHIGETDKQVADFLRAKAA